MTKAAFFGYLFLSCGPPLAVGLPFFWHRAFLSLTVITSMFAWLLIMIVTSMLFRGFVPLRSDVGPYSAMLVVTVLLEELARVGLWFVHTFSSRKLRDLAHTGYVRYDDQDELSLAYSIGWGHGFLHLLMQFLPFLPLTWHAPTVYSPECPQMSAFLVSCLSQLGFFAILAGVVLSSGPRVARMLPRHHVCRARCCLEDVSPSRARSSAVPPLPTHRCRGQPVSWTVSVSRSQRLASVTSTDGV